MEHAPRRETASRAALLLGPTAAGKTRQCCQMPSYGQPLSQIVSQRPDVGAWRTGYVEGQARGLPDNQLNPVYLDRTRWGLNRDTAPGQFVQSLALLPYRRIWGWNLLNDPLEVDQCTGYLVLSQME